MCIVDLFADTLAQYNDESEKYNTAMATHHSNAKSGGSSLQAKLDSEERCAISKSLL